MAELSRLACRRITNRESARRMRLKRQEEWAAIKRQVRCQSLSIGPCTLPTLRSLLAMPVNAKKTSQTMESDAVRVCMPA